MKPSPPRRPSSPSPPSHWTDRLRGHAYTLAPKVEHWLSPTVAPPSTEWRQTLESEGISGPVRVTGRYSQVPSSRTLVILIHGLGGCADSDYCRRTARQLHDAGYSSLRLSMRGAERNGDDIYHAALTDDIHTALRAPAFQSYERIALVGFSLGGHLALHAGIESDDPRLRTVTAISSPLDLAAGQRALDHPHKYPYRAYVLRELRAIYRAVAARNRAPTPVEQVDRVRTLRDWDACTVVPRFGFGDVDTYYRRASVGGVLDQLERPALMVASRLDPMVPPETITPSLPEAPDCLEMRWTSRGGHVYFPGDLDLEFGPRSGLISQILHWFESRA